MALEAKQKEIGGLTFEVTQLPYFRAQRLFVRLVRLAGPALVGLFTLAGGDARAAIAAAASIDLAELAKALSSFFAELDPDTMEELTKEILQTARVKQGDKWVLLLDGNNGRGVMDAVVGGDFWAGLMLQAFALQVHFGNFNSARGAFEALGPKATASPSAASNTSTDGRAASS